MHKNEAPHQGECRGQEEKEREKNLYFSVFITSPSDGMRGRDGGVRNESSAVDKFLMERNELRDVLVCLLVHICNDPVVALWFWTWIWVETKQLTTRPLPSIFPEMPFAAHSTLTLWTKQQSSRWFTRAEDTFPGPWPLVLQLDLNGCKSLNKYPRDGTEAEFKNTPSVEPPPSLYHLYHQNETITYSYKYIHTWIYVVYIQYMYLQTHI